MLTKRQFLLASLGAAIAATLVPVRKLEPAFAPHFDPEKGWVGGPYTAHFGQALTEDEVRQVAAAMRKYMDEHAPGCWEKFDTLYDYRIHPTLNLRSLA